METRITLGTATYTVSHHFTSEDRAVTKQKLLRDLLIQKMERQNCVDHEDSHGV